MRHFTRITHFSASAIRRFIVWKYLLEGTVWGYISLYGLIAYINEDEWRAFEISTGVDDDVVAWAVILTPLVIIGLYRMSKDERRLRNLISPLLGVALGVVLFAWTFIVSFIS